MADPRPLTHVAEFLLRHPPTDLTASSHLNDLCEEGEQSTTTLTQDLFHWLHTFQNCEDDCQFSFLYILALYCFRNVTHDWSTGAHLRLLGPWATEEQNPDVPSGGGLSGTATRTGATAAASSSSSCCSCCSTCSAACCYGNSEMPGVSVSGKKTS